AMHTTRGLTRRGLYLVPPAGSSFSAASFTSEVLGNLNSLLRSDLKSKDLDLISAHSSGGGVFIDASQTPTQAQTAFLLKHIRRLFPSPTGAKPIDSIKPTSTSYIKLVDIPIVPGPAKEWANRTSGALTEALHISPVGKSIADNLKHRPRIMRVS